MGFISGVYGGICVIMMFPEISKFFDLCLTVHLFLLVPQTASKTSLPLQMSYFYDFHLLALVFLDLQICISIYWQLFRGHLKFQLFPYSFFLSLLILLYVFTFVFYCFSNHSYLIWNFFCYFICFCHFYHPIVLYHIILC